MRGVRAKGSTSPVAQRLASGVDNLVDPCVDVDRYRQARKDGVSSIIVTTTVAEVENITDSTLFTTGTGDQLMPADQSSEARLCCEANRGNFGAAHVKNKEGCQNGDHEYFRIMVG